MLISLIKYPITTLGPGKRVGIWTYGCNKRCSGCMSKHTWEIDLSKGRTVSSIIEEVKHIIEGDTVDGVTVSGGEPFLQEDLNELLKGIKALGINDILVYTGYLIDELKDKMETIKNIGVLIDGPYVDELNDTVYH